MSGLTGKDPKLLMCRRIGVVVSMISACSPQCPNIEQDQMPVCG